MQRLFLLTALASVISVFVACSFHDAVVMEDTKAPGEVHVIALMPLENRTHDVRIPRLLQAKISEVLRFKGYPLAPDAADSEPALPVPAEKTLKGLTDTSGSISQGSGADAAMYCTLNEIHAKTAMFYAPATVALRCELRRMKTGETLWQAQHTSTSRSFDLIKARLKMKAEGALEEALEDVVGKVMETLPYGPKLRG